MSKLPDAMAVADEIERISQQFGDNGICIVDGEFCDDRFTQLNKAECDMIAAALRRPARVADARADLERAIAVIADLCGAGRPGVRESAEELAHWAEEFTDRYFDSPALPRAERGGAV